MIPRCPRLHAALLAFALGVAGVATVGVVGAAGPRTVDKSGYGSTLTIDGHGTFHAIGLGQWGALGYAVDHGWTSAQILAHYFGGTVPAKVDESDVTMRLSAHDGAQTAVIHDDGGAVLVGDDAAQGYSSLVAREVAPSSYDVWGRRDATVCPSSGAELSKGTGWKKVASGVGPVVTFSTVTNDPDSHDYSHLLGACRPDGAVRYYRGRIEALNASDGSNRTINLVPMEQLLRSVVAWEMSPSWADLGDGKGAQALRAQAIAARSYILSYAWYSYARSCDNICVAYRGAAVRSAGPTGSRVSYEDPRSTAAVEATAGTVLRRGSKTGSIALTMYSASTGGWTAPATGLAEFPTVEDEGDSYRAGLSGGNPWHDWTRTVSVSTIESKWPSIGTLRTIQPSRNGLGDWGGRVTSVTLVGSNGSVTLAGDAFPRALGLPSNWFRVRGDSSTTTSTSTTTSPTLTCGQRRPPAVVDALRPSAASGLRPTNAVVLADTRRTEALVGGCTLRAKSRVVDGTTAVVVNLRAIDPVAAGTVTVYGCGTARPTSPTLYSVPGRSVAADVVVALGSSTRLCVWSSTTADIVVESSGRFDPSGGLRFTPIAPVRALDTRTSVSVPGGSVLPISMRGRNGVGRSAKAVSVTVHALQASATGDVSVFPCAAGPSRAVVLTVRPGETVANGALVKLDTSGDLCIRPTSTMHLLLDVTGWFGRRGGSSYHAVAPSLVGDTRQNSLGGPMSAQENRRVAVVGKGGVPGSGVVALVATVSVIGAASESYLTVHPCVAEVPSLSMVRNVPPSGTAAAATFVGVSRGDWCLRPGTSMDVRIDVLGWFD